MILRAWSAIVTAEREAAYLEVVRRDVLPHLRRVPGYRGVWFGRRPVNGGWEYCVYSRWESMEAVRALAGPDPTTAYVPEAIQATLESWDPVVRHFEVIIDDGEADPIGV